jgi:IclR family pca regulon transcriptional regulator
MAILSSWRADEVMAWLEQYEIKPFTPFTLSSREQVLASILNASQQGYALLEQQLEVGVRGLAVPLKNHKAETIGALSLHMPIGNEETAEAVRRALPALQQVASELRNLV